MFWENMVAGAISRSIAQTIMHPANTLKTMLQTGRDGGLNMLELLAPQNFRRLTRGAGANFILSVPHGAVNFAVLEFVRSQLSTVVDATPYLSDRSDRLGPTLDFVSSAISTITCSIVSTPQMVIADNIMAGNYPNLFSAIRGLAENRGVAGFYTGWWPGLVGKIPSYALTWTFFQQLKEARDKLTGRPATDFENTIMGCVASGATVCIMIPLDTIKTRLVTQSAHSALSGVAYKGIVDCAIRVAREEGVRALYRGLTPRLVSVVPMIGIQFGVYEFMKKTLLERSAMSAAGTVDRAAPRRPVPGALQLPKRPAASTGPAAPAPKEHQTSACASSDPSSDPPTYGATEALQEAAMEVAASPEVPFPAPRFLKRMSKLKLETKLSMSRPSAKAKQ
jgi:Mitochondrial carrier protein